MLVNTKKQGGSYFQSQNFSLDEAILQKKTSKVHEKNLEQFT